MRVLLTGNLGYIGPVVLRSVAAKGKMDIWGLDVGFFNACRTQQVEEPSADRYLRGQFFSDVREIESNRDLLAFLPTCDAIVHLAALSNDPIGNEFSDLTESINTQASMRLADYAKKAGVKKFVFASSCSIYGSGNNGWCDESSPLAPLTAYARSKVDVENYLASISDKNFEAIALRFSTACGASPRMRLDLVLNDFVANAILYGKIDILSDGTPWRPIIDVKDMARAIEWACGYRPAAPFLAVNVGKDEWNFQVKDLANIVSNTLGGVAINLKSQTVGDKRSYRVNFQKYRELAQDFQPISEISDTVCEIRDAFNTLNFDPSQSFRESQYLRLNCLRNLMKNQYLDQNLFWR